MIKRFFTWFQEEPDTVGPILVVIVVFVAAIGTPPLFYYLSKWWSYWAP